MIYKAIAIGTSFGGLEALKIILPSFPEGFPLPIIVVLHIGDHNNESFLQYMNAICRLRVKEAESHEAISAGFIYFAPPNYHLLVETDWHVEYRSRRSFTGINLGIVRFWSCIGRLLGPDIVF